MTDFEAAEITTKEELTYLDLRSKLKEHYRKQFRQDSSTSTPPPLAATTERNNFGSFFGPSKPTVIPSVIKNTTSLLHFAVLRMSNSNPRHGLKKVVEQSTKTAKISKPNPKLVTKVDPEKTKLQKMKDARDYSFLYSDDAQPQPPVSKKVPDRTSPKKCRTALKEKKPVSLNDNIRKKAISASKMETTTLKTKVAVRIGKQEVTGIGKSINKGKAKPVVSSTTSSQLQPKKRSLHQMNTEEEEDDGFDYKSQIRKMFGYNPDKYQDERDTRDMEAGFQDILKEEKRSGLIARKEDQIELRRIEEEAMKERTMKSAKRRKLMQSS